MKSSGKFKFFNHMSQICMKFGTKVGIYEIMLSAKFFLKTCIFD